MFSHRFNPVIVGVVALLKTSSYLLTWNHAVPVPNDHHFNNQTYTNNIISTMTTMYTETILTATVATMTLTAEAPPITTETFITTTTITAAASIPTATITIDQVKNNDHSTGSNGDNSLFAYMLALIGSSPHFSDHTIATIQLIYEWYKDYEFLLQVFGFIASCVPVWICQRKYNKTNDRQRTIIADLTTRLRMVHRNHAELQLLHQASLAQTNDLVDLHAKKQSQIERLTVEILHEREKVLIFAERHAQMVDVTDKAQTDLKDLQRRFNQMRVAYKDLFAVLPEIAFREEINENGGDAKYTDSAMLAVANIQQELKSIEN